MLLSLMLFPFIGSLIISTDLHKYIFNKENTEKTMKIIGLFISIFTLILSLFIFALFDFSNNEFQFVQEYYNINNFDIYLGIDGLSIYFVLLTTIIIPISLLSN
jgi:NADH:ubiquinone oxidoreductase subunit 4 (subunit M)